MATQKIMQSPARPPRGFFSDSNIICEKFDETTTILDSNDDDNPNAEPTTANGTFYDPESDPDENDYSPAEDIDEYTKDTKMNEIERNLKYSTSSFSQRSIEIEPDLFSESWNSIPSLETLDFSDDEIEVRVDRLNFYKHQNIVTKTTWIATLPEPQRLAYVPFFTRNDGKSILASIDTKLHFVKQISYDETFYMSFLTIYNESNNLATFMVRQSNPEKLKVRSPSIGFINPKDSTKVMLYTNKNFLNFYDLLTESVTIYVVPFKIIGLEDTKYLDWNDQTTMHGINLKHFELFWNNYNSPSFPKAEVHSIKTFTSDDPLNKHNTKSSFTQNICTRLTNSNGLFQGIFNPNIEKSYLLKNAEKTINHGLKDDYNLVSVQKEILCLKLDIMDLKKENENSQMIWKLGKLILFSLSVCYMLSPQEPLLPIFKYFFNFMEPEPPSLWTWTWWSNIFYKH